MRTADGRHVAEPDLDDLRAEYPGWQISRNTLTLTCFAQPPGEPALRLRGEDPLDLRDEIRGWIGRRG